MLGNMWEESLVVKDSFRGGKMVIGIQVNMLRFGLTP